jgi:PleD family two-component response regulator
MGPTSYSQLCQTLQTSSKREATVHEVIRESPVFAVGRKATKTVIALVDDESAVLSAVSRLLRSHNFECLTYESGEAALADSNFLSASCIVMDIQMPCMDGFEFSRVGPAHRRHAISAQAVRRKPADNYD